MLRSTFIVLCFAFLVNCKPGQTDPCQASGVKAALSKAAMLNIESQSNPSRLGGYLNARLNASLIEGHKVLTTRIEADDELQEKFGSTGKLGKNLYAGVYKDQSCTGLFDFYYDQDNRLKLYVWTSRHCLAFPFVEQMSVQISTNRGYIELPFNSEFSVPNEKIGQYLHLDYNAFLPFFLTAKPIEFRKGQLPTLKANAENYEPIATYLNEKIPEQEHIFQRQLCNSFNGDLIEIRNIPVAKLCFNLKDLMVVEGFVDLDKLEGEKRSHLFEMIDKSISERDEFFLKNSELVSKFATWRNAIELLSLASYSEKLKIVALYLQITCRSGPFGASSELCKDPEAIESIVMEDKRAESLLIEKMKKVRLPEYFEKQYSEPQESFFGSQKHFLSIARDYIQPLWIDMVSTIGGVESLYIHTNVQSDDKAEVAYKTLSYLAMIRETQYPPLVQPMGFVHLLPKDYIHFTKSDSGSVVTLGGYFPLITLSTVNDDESSGGYGDHPAPQYKDSDILGHEGQDKSASVEKVPSPITSQGRKETHTDSSATDIDVKKSDAPENGTPSIYDDAEVRPVEESLAQITVEPKGDRCAGR